MKCPVCGREVGENLTSCPFCKTDLSAVLEFHEKARNVFAASIRAYRRGEFEKCVELFRKGEGISPTSYKEEELIAYLNSLIYTFNMEEARKALQKVENAKLKKELSEKISKSEDVLERSVLHHNYAVQLAKRRFFISALSHAERSLLLRPTEKSEKLRLKLLLSLGENEKFIKGAVAYLFRSEDAELESLLTNLTSSLLFKNKLLSRSLRNVLWLLIPLYLLNAGILLMLLLK